jgi:polysaccharide deacetylase 2 family uncharacterized protein YibQ
MARRGKRRARLRWFLLAAAGVALFAIGLVLGKMPAPVERLWEKRPRLAEPAPPRAGAKVPAGPAARDPAAEAPARIVHPAGPTPVARIAIVLDDLGGDLGTIDRILGWKVPLGYAVLPYEPATAAVAARIRERGGELLCHLPMESEAGLDPGPGAVSLGMDAGEIARRTRAAIAAVPGAVGVNNHMGSLLTADRDAMRSILGVVAELELFFLDSRTTPESVGEEVALEIGLPTARRDVFLDSAPFEAPVDAEFERLLELARERGAAIAIGHPQPATLDLLERELPALKARGFELVPVSYLLERSETLPE